MKFNNRFLEMDFLNGTFSYQDARGHLIEKINELADCYLKVFDQIQKSTLSNVKG